MKTKIILLIIIIALLFPVGVICGQIGYDCTPPPDENGLIHRTVLYKPLIIHLINQNFGTEIKFGYFRATNSSKN